LFRDGQFYSARFIGGRNRSSLKNILEILIKKIKREYLGRIIDNVDFFVMNSHVHILFSSTVMCGFYFSSTVALLFLIGNNINVISM
jgi:hypothetical protein